MKHFFDFLTTIFGGILGLIYACFGLLFISVIVFGLIIGFVLFFPFLVYIIIKG